MTSVLIIEDEPLVRKGVAIVLETAGYDVATAEDGLVGVKMAQTNVPDLVISDITMPKLDGYKVLKYIREDPLTASIPFIFMTAHGSRSDLRKGMDLGADDYLTKPFTSAELISAVQSRLLKQSTITKKHETTLRLLRKNIIYALPHEIRTPLQLVLGYSEVMKADALTLAPEEVSSMAESILKASKRLHRLFENYLIYAQIELMTDPAEVEALRNFIVADPARIIQEQAEQTAIRWNRQLDLHVELVNVGLQISAENLKKIVDELVDNAFKFSEPGSQVSVEAVRDKAKFVLQIRDCGRGMTKEQIQQIGAWTQFERALHEQQGLGLGFSIAKRLIDLHQGTLSLLSTPNEGTLVTIQFPT